MEFKVGLSGRESVVRVVAVASVVTTGLLFLLPFGDSATLWASELGSVVAATVLLVALWQATGHSSGWDRLAWGSIATSSAVLVLLYLLDPVRPGSSATEFPAAFLFGPVIGLVQLGAVALLARRVVRSVPFLRLILDSIWLATSSLLITWGAAAGPVLDRADIGFWPTVSLVSETSVAALLLGLVVGLMVLADARGRRALLVISAPAMAMIALQVTYGRAYIESRLAVGGMVDFVLPLSLSLAAVAVLEWRRVPSIRSRHVRPGHGQMIITLVPLCVWAAAVMASRLSVIPEQRWLGIVIGVLALIRLMVLVLENARLAAKFHEQNRRDRLTGLPNIVALESMIDDVGDGPAALILVDLKRFKLVNDTFGHKVGDSLLAMVGQRIELAVGPGWTTVRAAGVQFVTLRTEETEQETLADLGRRIIDRLSLPFHIEGCEAWIGARVGVAGTDDGLHPNELLEVADLALRSAGDEYRGEVVVAEGELIRRNRGRQSLEVAIQHAIERDELFTVFQPKVDITTGAMVGAEALVRWDRPGVGIVPPDEFIPVAETTGLISRIDTWVLADAIDHLCRWNEMRGRMPRLKLSVNMSAWQLARVDVDAEVERAISWVGGVDPAQLTIELTETVLIDDPDVVERRLRKLRSLGVGVSVDDFGSGFTSVAYLRKFPVTEVKIDRDLVWELDGTTADTMSLAAAVIALAHAIDLEIVAEGVETLQHAESLKRLGARIGQGYYFAKPVRADEIDAIITKPFPFAHLIAGDAEHPQSTASVHGGTASARP